MGHLSSTCGDVLSLPSLPPGPSRLVTVPTSLLEKDGQYEVHFRPLSGGTLLCSIVAGDVGWMLGLIPQTREGHGCSVVGLQETTPQTPPLPPRCVQVLQPLLSFIPAQELI